VLTAGPVSADEGMWTFDNFPSAAVAKKFNVQIDGKWLNRVQESIVRLSNCTATYVSADGLILTNHHCAAECLADNSTPEHSLIETGFLAADRSQEKKCGTQIADTLVAMENITDKVNAATHGMDAKKANETRKRTLTALEQGCEEASKKDAEHGELKCESVELYHGGQYFLYKYKRYTDIRLVFAPEGGIAAFGGDPDNFQFPRYCLDMSVMRAYENGKPAHTPNHLKIDFNGPKAGDVIFVAGHPGFRAGEVSTGWVGEHWDGPAAASEAGALARLAAATSVAASGWFPLATGQGARTSRSAVTAVGGWPTSGEKASDDGAGSWADAALEAMVDRWPAT